MWKLKTRATNRYVECSSVEVCFFDYQLAVLQCFDVSEAVLFWLSKRKGVLKKNFKKNHRILCIFDILKLNMYKQFKVLISTQ